MSPTRDTREAKTVELPRPAVPALPAGWHSEAGQYVHDLGSLEMDSATDDDLADAEQFARATVALIAWERRRRAIAARYMSDEPQGAA